MSSRLSSTDLRITSYNVCYTKLLRYRQFRRLKGEAARLGAAGIIRADLVAVYLFRPVGIQAFQPREVHAALAVA